MGDGHGYPGYCSLHPLYQVIAAMQPPDPIPDSSFLPEEVERVFSEADTLIQKLRQEFQQVQKIRHQIAPETDQSAPSGFEENSFPEGRTERLKTKLEQLELELAFTILSNLGEAARSQLEVLSQQESFWQLIRFAGLGFILGIGIKALTG
jgi:hypothetical protein